MIRLMARERIITLSRALMYLIWVDPIYLLWRFLFMQMGGRTSEQRLGISHRPWQETDDRPFVLLGFFFFYLLLKLIIGSLTKEVFGQDRAEFRWMGAAGEGGKGRGCEGERGVNDSSQGKKIILDLCICQNDHVRIFTFLFYALVL